MDFKQQLEALIKESSYYRATPWIIEEDIPDAVKVESEIVGSSRWANDVEAVYTHGGRYWQVSYEEPATEMQDWDSETTTCIEVVPKEITRIVYVPAT